MSETRKELVERVIEACAKEVEQAGKDYVAKWGDLDDGNGLDENAKSYAWDCLQHAIAIRSLDLSRFDEPAAPSGITIPPLDMPADTVGHTKAVAAAPAQETGTPRTDFWSRRITKLICNPDSANSVDVLRMATELAAAREELEREYKQHTYWHDAFQVAEGLRADAEDRRKAAESRLREAEKVMHTAADQLKRGEWNSYTSGTWQILTAALAREAGEGPNA